MDRNGTPSIKRWLLATTLVAGMVPTSSFAQASDDEVLLKSADGSISVSGKLLEFTDEFYILQTSLGNLRVSSERVSCVGTACPVIEVAEADIQIIGSGAIGTGLMPLLLDGYSSFVDAEASIAKTSQPGQIIANMIADQGFGDEMDSFLVTAASTTSGFESLLSNEAQVTMASRRILPAEARALKQAGAGNMISPRQEHIVAVGSVVVITNPANPVNDLSVDQLKGIYSGSITNWSEVGGPDLEIQPVGFPEQNDIFGTFKNRIFGGAPGALASNIVTSDDFNVVANTVSDNPGAIAYTGFAFMRGNKPVTVVDECNIPMVPDTFSAKTEEYSLQSRMYLYNRADASNDSVQQFLDYVVSHEADNVILKSGFIDLGIETRSQDQDSSRVQQLMQASLDRYERDVANEMLVQMEGYDRLSTFRFRTASSKLDERGRLDLERLVAYLRNQGDGAEVMLVGFTDDVGAFSSNLELSKRRAQEMAGQLKDALNGEVDGVSIKTTGFGSISPSACNLSDHGRSVNRRVEVWIQRGA
jgi:phosphate transport system substrate-binding protein